MKVLSNEHAYATNKFKKKYFDIRYKVRLDLLNKSIYEYWIELAEDYEKIDKVYLMDYIREAYDCKVKWKYDIFLTRTLYWQIISWYIKLTRKCCEFSVYHTNKRLEVHHQTYDIFGIELLHMDKLKCLCESCHENGHKFYHPEMSHEPRPESEEEYQNNFKELIVTIDDDVIPNVSNEVIPAIETPIIKSNEIDSLLVNDKIFNSPKDTSMELILLKGDSVIHKLKLLAYLKKQKNGVSQ